MGKATPIDAKYGADWTCQISSRSRRAPDEPAILGLDLNALNEYVSNIAPQAACVRMLAASRTPSSQTTRLRSRKYSLVLLTSRVPKLRCRE